MHMSPMLEISHAEVPKRAPGGPQGPLQGQLGALGACREGPMVGQNDLYKPKMTYLSQKILFFNIEC